MEKPHTSARVIRWLLLLQEFDLVILDKSWKHNVVANFQSRLTHVQDKKLVEDTFPNC